MKHICFNATHRRSLIAYFISVMCLFACSEDQRGQFPIDSIPPQQVSNPVVTNFPGGASIVYQLPDESDLLYVKAVHQLPNGTIQEVKASNFSNSLIVKGYGKSTSATVKLISVDRSRNESKPVEVIIHPEDSPIYDIYGSLNIEAGWGGFTVKWENPLKEDVILSVLQQNEEGVYEHIETIYSSAQDAFQSVRGLEAVSTNFAIYVRDVYNNSTDTLRQTLTPWYEALLDKNNFVGLPKSVKFVVSQFGTSNMNVMWDGIIVNSDGVVTSSELYYFNSGAYQPYFAIDLGIKAKLSRFRFWSRPDYYFRLHSPKYIQMFGTNDPIVANNPESEDAKWILLNPDVFVSTRPSGSDNTVPAGDIEEDWNYAVDGEEFIFPLDVPNVRYIRFKSLESWTGTLGLTCAEIRFWGNPNVEQ